MGLDGLVDAFADVRRRVPDALLVIAGRGPLLEALRAQARDLGLAGHVQQKIFTNLVLRGYLDGDGRVVEDAVGATADGFRLGGDFEAVRAPLFALVGALCAEADEDGPRALGLGRCDGVTKLLVDPQTRRILGAGMVGVAAGDLVAEVAHAMEMGADAEDLALTVHPHPTLSETVGLAAEAAEGTITDLYVPKRARSAA